MINPHFYWGRLLRRFHAWEDGCLDLALGIRAGREKIATVHETLCGDADEYAPVRARRFISVLRKLKINRGDAFLDLGCGMGRALALASFFPFSRISGWELRPELTSRARANMRVLRRNPFQRCDQIEIINGDAAALAIPDDVTCIFLFNPFGEKTISAVAENISKSLRRSSRSIKIIYFAPVYSERLLEILKDNGVHARISQSMADHAIFELGESKDCAARSLEK